MFEKYSDVYKDGFLPNDIEWKPLLGEEDKYHISNYGHIKRLKRTDCYNNGKKRTYPEKIFCPKLIRKKGKTDNYYTRISYGWKRELTHRLVAKNFLENLNNYPEVNHKDGNKKFLSYAGTAKNNYQDGNLEWCTRKMNMEHASVTGLLNKDSEKRKEACRRNQKISVEKNTKPVLMYDLDYNFLAEFKSQTVAGKLLNIPSANIGRSCRTNYYSAGGYYWKFK